MLWLKKKCSDAEEPLYKKVTFSEKPQLKIPRTRSAEYEVTSHRNMETPLTPLQDM